MKIQKYPCIATRCLFVLPGVVTDFELSRKKSLRALEEAMIGNDQVFIAVQKDSATEDPKEEDLCRVGCIACVKEVIKTGEEGVVRVLVEGLAEAKIQEFFDNGSYLETDVSFPVVEEEIDEIRIRAMIDELRLNVLVDYGTFHESAFKSMNLHWPVAEKYDVEYFHKVLWVILSNMVGGSAKIMEVLDGTTVEERFLRLTGLIHDDVAVQRVRAELNNKAKQLARENQREFLLREQLKAIRDELGPDEEDSDVDRLSKKLADLKASETVKEHIGKEIRRLKRLEHSQSEEAVQVDYIETLLEFPWEEQSEDCKELATAEKILDRDHYGLRDVKERILEYLAVHMLNQGRDSSILCLVGPPGTGKTSIARSIAEALNRKYVRVCLGGVADEAEIRGHRRTYVGALPGRIVEGLMQAKVRNPLMLLDEIDKVGKERRGDTASALLEVLDSEQNRHFKDHYLEVEADLSQVLFLATANDPGQIPKPLRDRMEIITIPGYTANEKFHIAKEHLVPKQMEECGLKKGSLKITDSCLEKIISCYTREAGVRELERKITAICRKSARKFLTGEATKLSVGTRNLEEYLGKEKYRKDSVATHNEVGIVTGLAWTEVGGDILEVEVNLLNGGKGELKLTGQLGDVMKESAQAGLSYIRSVSEKYRIPVETFQNCDIHVHVPEGAVPKDGPSAGITMTTAMLSALTGRPVKAEVAMTGEVTLRGRVLPIGGLKEKLLAAKSAKVKTVLIPAENLADVEEMEEEITSGLRIVPVRKMEEVLKEALC